ncbi:MAG TPA: hypothetical protein VK832_15940 [Burkholderiaceae bacterium]|nr:hypothetical protein [Burkholderiaceae bacterium]
MDMAMSGVSLDKPLNVLEAVQWLRSMPFGEFMIDIRGRADESEWLKTVNQMVQTHPSTIAVLTIDRAMNFKE